MMQILENSILVEAIINLKNGGRKYGKLVEGSPEKDNYFFIPNTNGIINLFKSPEIEIIPVVMIDSIETDLK
jgi:hypothetical protein